MRDWLKSLDKATRHEIGTDIAKVQRMWPISKPLVDSFGGGLYEVRTRTGAGIYRVLFCIDGSDVVLLHGFMKKTQKTPKRELDLARKRQKEV